MCIRDRHTPRCTGYWSSPAVELWTDNLILGVHVSHIYNTSVFRHFLPDSVALIVASLFLVFSLYRNLFLVPLHYCDLLVRALYDLRNQTLTVGFKL